MARLLVAHGLPPAAFQFEVRGPGGRLIGRVDFAHPDRRLAVEVAATIRSVLRSRTVA